MVDFQISPDIITNHNNNYPQQLKCVIVVVVDIDSVGIVVVDIDLVGIVVVDIDSVGIVEVTKRNSNPKCYPRACVKYALYIFVHASLNGPDCYKDVF